jgi:hypothetical protein
MIEIPGAELLTRVFGRWPSFHDAEVVRIALERTSDFAAGPACELDIHVFEMTSELDEKNHYVLRYHTLVTLRCEGLRESDLSGFNNQNVLAGLDLLETDRREDDRVRYELTLDPSYGVSARFACESVRVVAAMAWNPETSAPAA